MPNQSGEVSYIAIAPLERLEARQSFSEFPAHITIVPWFTLKRPEDIDGVRTAIEEDLMVEWNMGSPEGYERVMFGPDKDMPATRLANFAFNALGVHDCVLGILSRCEAVFDTTYTELNDFSYRPHVSDTPDRSVAVGEKLTLPQLAIVRRALGDTIKVVDSVFNWSRNEA